MLIGIALVFVLGIAAKKLFASIRLPGLVGLVILGILLGPYMLNVFDPVFLSLANDLRLFALITILMRAGLGMNRQILKRIGKTALKMSAMPGLCEGLTIMFLSMYLLGFSWQQGGMLGFILAAVSPAVVVPSMLTLRDQGLGNKKSIPMLILAGASLDDVFAITMFSLFVGFATGSAAPGSTGAAFAMVPLEIGGGILLGVMGGLIVNQILVRLESESTEQLLIVLAAAIGVSWLGKLLSLAGLLAVMAVGFILQDRGNGYVSSLADNLNHLWIAMQLFLFVLIGTAVNLEVVLHSGRSGLLLLICGLAARSVGVFIATRHSSLNWNERKFCAIAYLPKATVQAAIGGVPLAMGIPGGDIMLAISVLSIIVTAPLGAVGIQYFAPRLLEKEN